MTANAYRALRSHLAVLEALSHGPRPFSQVAGILSGLHERTLRTALKGLIAQGLVTSTKQGKASVWSITPAGSAAVRTNGGINGPEARTNGGTNGAAIDDINDAAIGARARALSSSLPCMKYNSSPPSSPSLHTRREERHGREEEERIPLQEENADVREDANAPPSTAAASTPDTRPWFGPMVHANGPEQGPMVRIIDALLADLRIERARVAELTDALLAGRVSRDDWERRLCGYPTLHGMDCTCARPLSHPPGEVERPRSSAPPAQAPVPSPGAGVPAEPAKPAASNGSHVNGGPRAVVPAAPPVAGGLNGKTRPSPVSPLAPGALPSDPPGLTPAQVSRAELEALKASPPLPAKPTSAPTIASSRPSQERGKAARPLWDTSVPWRAEVHEAALRIFQASVKPGDTKTPADKAQDLTHYLPEHVTRAVSDVLLRRELGTSMRSEAANLWAAVTDPDHKFCEGASPSWDAHKAAIERLKAQGNREALGHAPTLEDVDARARDARSAKDRAARHAMATQAAEVGARTKSRMAWFKAQAPDIQASINADARARAIRDGGKPEGTSWPMRLGSALDDVLDEVMGEGVGA